MKILHVIPSYKPAYLYGGPIESVARLCETLQAQNHAVFVYTTTANGDKELDVLINKQLIVDGVNVTYFNRITKDPTHVSPRLWWELYKRCNEFDVIHIHSWWNILVIVAALIGHLRGAKVVISPRGMLSDYIVSNSHSLIKQLIHWSVGKRALAKAVFHATSELEYTECRKMIPGWRGFLLPNILQLPAEPTPQPDNEVFTMLFLSRIHPKKGLELLFEAISRLDLDVKLKIAGKGDETYIKSLNQLALQLNISQKIDWIGWKNREAKFTELVKADVFVLTSFNENFANVVIESLSVGTPVLISDKVGLSNYIIENNLGWVTQLTVDSIVSTLRSAVLDRQKRAFIASHSRENILADFSETALAKQYIDHYKQL